MIKKFFVSFFVLLFWFISFSNSEWVIRQVWNYSVSTVDDSIDLNVVNKWQLLSQRFWNTKRMLAFSSNSSIGRVYFFWSNDQLPYYLINYWLYKDQWFLKNYFICPEITTWSYNPFTNDCTTHTISSDTFAWEVWWFLQSIDSSDYWGYNISIDRCYWSPLLVHNLLCFSSSEYHNSLCFWASYDIADRCSLYSFWDLTTNNLRWSLWINLSWDFTFVDDRFLNTPPWFTPINKFDWSNSSSINVSMTWNLMYNDSCTNWYVISQIDSIMWPEYINACYAWTYNTWLIDNNFQWETYIYNYWLTYRDLFKLTSDWMSWNNWFSTYSDEITRFRNWSVWVNPFLSRPVALYTYFDNLYNWGFLGWNNNTFLLWPFAYNNYCNLVLYSDYNSVYSWSYFSQFCDNLNYSTDSNFKINTWVVGGVDDDEILPPWSNNNWNKSWNIVSVSWSWVLSWDSNKNFDWKNFINDFYQKLISNYIKSTSNDTWIIPPYIIVFLVAIILFRFLRK